MATNPTLKRQITDVDSIQSPPSASRLRFTQGSEIGKGSMHNGSGMITKATQAPTTKDTPTARSIEDPEEGDSQDSCKDSATSIVDFDPMDETMTSQQTAATETSQPGQSAVSTRAELLRLRLRVAMFKVRTGQTNLPLSQLRISPDSPQIQDSASNGSSERPVSLPRLLPAPELKPTAYSARNISQVQLPSSPPSSRTNSPNSDLQDQVLQTPALSKVKAHLVKEQLSSPPNSQGRNEKVAEGPESLTSSALRGSVARSLLGLAQRG